MTAKLTRTEQRELAAALIAAAGDLLYTRYTSNQVEVPAEIPEGIDPDAAARQFATWLKSLPGASENWDDAMPRPEEL